MTNYREILRLSSLGLNKTQIAQSVGCSRTTVIQVLNIAEEKGISYPLPPDLSDKCYVGRPLLLSVATRQ